MELAEAITLLDKLLKQNQESEWVEFKLNYHSAEEIGQRISALSNGACLEMLIKNSAKWIKMIEFGLVISIVV